MEPIELDAGLLTLHFDMQMKSHGYTADVEDWGFI